MPSFVNSNGRYRLNEGKIVDADVAFHLPLVLVLSVPAFALCTRCVSLISAGNLSLNRPLKEADLRNYFSCCTWQNEIPQTEALLKWKRFNLRPGISQGLVLGS